MEELMKNLELLSNEIEGYKSLNQRLDNYKDLSATNVQLLKDHLQSVKGLTNELGISSKKVNSEFDNVVKLLDVLSESVEKVTKDTKKSIVSIEDKTNKVLLVQEEIDRKIYDTLKDVKNDLEASNSKVISQLTDKTISNIDEHVKAIRKNFSMITNEMSNQLKTSKMINIGGFGLIVLLLLLVFIFK